MENRTFKQIEEHYKIEKGLADKLRNANKKERLGLYASLYDELFKRIPHHPQLTQKRNHRHRHLEVDRQMNLLNRFLTCKAKFLEVGPGDCSLSLEVAKHVKEVYAIDVSKEITKDEISSQNFSLIISNSLKIPVPKRSIDVVYSRFLMEHLHPDDALEQLKNIYNALVPGGKYICITPNKLSGPHDISTYFDEEATGFHLREYSVSELCKIFHKIGFARIHFYMGGRGIYVRFPLFMVKLFEKLIGFMPDLLRKKIVCSLPFQALLGITMIGIKDKEG